MKIYLLYLISNGMLYAVTDNKTYLNEFLRQRNPKCFKRISKKMDNSECLKILTDNRLLVLDSIPLESSDGDCNIIGTTQEDNMLSSVCEKMAESCEYFKLHFTKNVPFNIEYKELIDNLTTISKNINNHPIIQIDSVKLFYYLFKETFVEHHQIESDDEIIDNYKKYN